VRIWCTDLRSTDVFVRIIYADYLSRNVDLKNNCAKVRVCCAVF
jgi:hypothetical protein